MAFWISLQTLAIALGFVLDFFIGDPYCLPHPVVGIGRWISFFDRRLRRGDSHPKDVFRGALTVCLVVTLSTIPPALVLFFLWKLHPVAYLVVDSLMCGQLLAARQLVREADKVRTALERGDTEGARTAVSFIVGRDTAVLDEKGICRAAAETVAENTSDGVIAPLFFMLLFGAVGGFFYKAVNTMDSMLGYRNRRYLTFGRAAAKTDDFVNFLPARLSALLMLLACPCLRLDGRRAFRVFLRDRFKHASPNSAQAESVCAGALGVCLLGDAYYGGVLYHKEEIGDPVREIESEDIRRAGRLMYVSSFFMLLLVVILRLALICVLS